MVVPDKVVKGTLVFRELVYVCIRRKRENRKRGGRETKGAEEARVEFALKGVRFNSPTGHHVTPTPSSPLHLNLLSSFKKRKNVLWKTENTQLKNCLREAEIESLTLGGLVRVNRLRRADSVHMGSQLHSLSSYTSTLPTRIPAQPEALQSCGLPRFPAMVVVV